MWVLYGFILMFCNFYRLVLPNETRVALANLQQRNAKKIRFISHVLVMISQKCTFVESLIKYTNVANGVYR